MKSWRQRISIIPCSSSLIVSVVLSRIRLVSLWIITTPDWESAAQGEVCPGLLGWSWQNEHSVAIPSDVPHREPEIITMWVFLKRTKFTRLVMKFASTKKRPGWLRWTGAYVCSTENVIPHARIKGCCISIYKRSPSATSHIWPSSVSLPLVRGRHRFALLQNCHSKSIANTLPILLSMIIHVIQKGCMIVTNVGVNSYRRCWINICGTSIELSVGFKDWMNYQESTI